MSSQKITLLTLILILVLAGTYFWHTKTPVSSELDNWIHASTTPQGIDFLYPPTLPTTYISTVAWPPDVTLTSGDLSCAKQNEHLMGAQKYCLVLQDEGAAGSIYKTYEYTTQQGDVVARVKFILRFPQCMNYDEPNQSTCTKEQTSFSVDDLALRIVSSIKKH